MNTQQRAAIAAELANLSEGRPKKTLSNDNVSDTPPVTIAELPELDIDLSGFECDPLPELVIDLPEIVIDFEPEAYT